MEQGQIMEAAIASTQLVKDDTPTMEPLEHELKNENTEVVDLNNEIIGKITFISHIRSIKIVETKSDSVKS